MSYFVGFRIFLGVRIIVGGSMTPVRARARVRGATPKSLPKTSKVGLKCVPGAVFFHFWETVISCNTTLVLLDLGSLGVPRATKTQEGCCSGIRPGPGPGPGPALGSYFPTNSTKNPKYKTPLPDKFHENPDKFYEKSEILDSPSRQILRKPRQILRKTRNIRLEN